MINSIVVASGAQGTDLDRVRDTAIQLKEAQGEQQQKPEFPTITVPFTPTGCAVLSDKKMQRLCSLLKRHAKHKQVIGIAGARLVGNRVYVRLVCEVGGGGWGLGPLGAGAWGRWGLGPVCWGAGGWGLYRFPPSVQTC